MRWLKVNTGSAVKVSTGMEPMIFFIISSTPPLKIKIKKQQRKGKSKTPWFYYIKAILPGLQSI